MTPSGGGDDDDDGARVESIGVIEGVDRLRDGQGNCVCVCACMYVDHGDGGEIYFGGNILPTDIERERQTLTFSLCCCCCRQTQLLFS